MAPNFTVHASTTMVRKEDFDHTSRISEAFARHVTSRVLPPQRYPTRCSFNAERRASGIRLRFTGTVENLDKPVTVRHTFFFIDRDETRERVHRLTPEQPTATTELPVLLDDKDRDYCHAAIFDAQDRLVAVEAVVFDREGRTTAYPFTAQYVSPLRLDRADLEEIRDDEGRRVLRFGVGLAGLTRPERVVIALQASGVIDRMELVCTPDRPHVNRDIPLDGNPGLAPGDWVLIAVDERERFLAQSLLTVCAAP